jgi:hypothetical protein
MDYSTLGTTSLSDVRPIAVESWLRQLPLAKSSCAKIRNLFSVVFNHACRYEFFDGNPITFVRQGATRRTVPTALTPAEIRLLLTNMGPRERTLLLLAASTGLRQSELFALQWSDIDFSQEIMSVTCSIVDGVVGCCKTESSRKPVPLHFRFARRCFSGEESVTIRNPTIGCSRVGVTVEGDHIGARRSYADTFSPSPTASESRKRSVGIPSATPTRPCCEALELSSR